MDSFQTCSVQKIAATEMPQRLIYTALYSARFGGSLAEKELQRENDRNQYAEDSCGHYITEHYRNSSNKLPSWNLYSPLEHPTISFEIRANHSTIYELAVESNSLVFTNQTLEEVAEGTQVLLKNKSIPIESLFGSRPIGNYPDHAGHRHPWSVEDKEDQLSFGLSTALDIQDKKEKGIAAEQSSQWLTVNVLQNSIASGSLRSWLQLLDSHSRPHKSYEMRDVMSKISDHIQSWIPEVYSWWSTQHRSKLDLRV